MPEVNFNTKVDKKESLNHPGRWFFSQGLFTKTAMLTVFALAIVLPIFFNANSSATTKSSAAINTPTFIPTQAQNTNYSCLLVKGQYCSRNTCVYSGIGKCPSGLSNCCKK